MFKVQESSAHPAVKGELHRQLANLMILKVVEFFSRKGLQWVWLNIFITKPKKIITT